MSERVQNWLNWLYKINDLHCYGNPEEHEKQNIYTVKILSKIVSVISTLFYTYIYIIYITIYIYTFYTYILYSNFVCFPLSPR